jgi:hypothetical protein
VSALLRRQRTTLMARWRVSAEEGPAQEMGTSAAHYDWTQGQEKARPRDDREAASRPSQYSVSPKGKFNTLSAIAIAWLTYVYGFSYSNSNESMIICCLRRNLS